MAERNRSVAVKFKFEKEGDPGIADVKDELGSLQDAAEQAGQPLDELTTAAEQASEAVDKLATEAEGAAGEVADLGDAAGDASGGIGDLKGAADEAAEGVGGIGKASGDALPKFTSLDDAVKGFQANPAKFMNIATAVYETAKASYEAGEKFRAFANEVTNGEFDNFIQKFHPTIALVSKFVEGTEDAEEASLRLKNMLNVLGEEGIDTTGMSLEQVTARFEEYGRAAQKSVMDNAAAAKGFDELAQAAEAALQQRIDDSVAEGNKKRETEFQEYMAQQDELSRQLAESWAGAGEAVRQVAEAVTTVDTAPLKAVAATMREVIAVSNEAAAAIQRVVKVGTESSVFQPNREAGWFANPDEGPTRRNTGDAA